MKIAIYSRKSKFTGKGESVENQIQLCKEQGLKYLGASEYCFSIKVVTQNVGHEICKLY